jgi:hypothetical protein
MKRRGNRPVVIGDFTEPVKQTPEREAHHVDIGYEVVAEYGAVRRIKSGVLQLRQAGDIGDAEVVASERWYRDFATCEHGARVESLGAVRGGDPAGIADAVLLARTAYRQAQEDLGRMTDLRLRMFIGEGMSLKKVAQELDMPNQTRLTGMVIADLQALAAHYARVDRARKV